MAKRRVSAEPDRLGAPAGPSSQRPGPRHTARTVPRENVEVVRSILKPLEGVNLAAVDWSAQALGDAIGRAYSPDIELTTLASGMGSGVGKFYRGLDGLARYLTEWLEPFSEYQVENLDYVQAGDCVLVPTRQWGVGAGSGARVELELTALYELRDGRIARIHQYDTLDEALAAAARPA